MIDPHMPIASVSTNDLFNELQRRLLSQSYPALWTIANQIDAIHHDFAEQQATLPVGQRV